MISIVQNFICTKELRLKVLEKNMPLVGEIFKDNDLENFNKKLEFLKDYSNIYYKILCAPIGVYVEEQIQSILKNGISPSKIFLMPLGTTPQEIERSIPTVLDMAEKYRTNLTSRIHIMHSFI